VNESTQCPYEVDDDTLRRYAAGGLSPEAAESFEEHLFACDRCARELERAIEVRSALAGDARFERYATPTISRRFRYSFLAAAAAALIITLGFWQSRSAHILIPEPTRGAEARPLAATGSIVGETFNIHWQRHPRARQYLVQFFGEDGASLQSIRTSDTTAAVPLSGPIAVRAFYWNVQALDADGVAIDRSELQRVVRPDAR
jgi:hypothetical protein